MSPVSNFIYKGAMFVCMLACMNALCASFREELSTVDCSLEITVSVWVGMGVCPLESVHPFRNQGNDTATAQSWQSNYSFLFLIRF